MRTRVMNQLHVVPLNEGLQRKKALWRPVGRNAKQRTWRGTLLSNAPPLKLCVNNGEIKDIAAIMIHLSLPRSGEHFILDETGANAITVATERWFQTMSA
jgi:hypothetical protein